jgi:hypothetical protein
MYPSIQRSGIPNYRENRSSRSRTHGKSAASILKQQISLYATTTGIKWDFNEEHILAGQVAAQPKGGIRRFCIDPNEYSNFEIAKHLLWSLMETGTYAASISSE